MIKAISTWFTNFLNNIAQALEVRRIKKVKYEEEKLRDKMVLEAAQTKRIRKLTRNIERNK